MSTTQVSSDRTRSIVYVAAGVVAGLIWPLIGVVVSVVLALVAKNRTLRIILIALAVFWLLFALAFTSFPGSSSSTTGG